MQPLDHLIPYFEILSEEKLKQQLPLEACLSETSQKINALVTELESLTESHTPKQESLLNQINALQKKLQDCLEIKKINKLIRDVNAIYHEFQETVNPLLNQKSYNDLPEEMILALTHNLDDEYLLSHDHTLNRQFIQLSLKKIRENQFLLNETYLGLIKTVVDQQKKDYQALEKQLNDLIDLSERLESHSFKSLLTQYFHNSPPLFPLTHLRNQEDHASITEVYIPPNLSLCLSDFQQFLHENLTMNAAEFREDFELHLQDFKEEMTELNEHLEKMEQSIADMSKMSQELKKARSWGQLHEMGKEFSLRFNHLYIYFIALFKLDLLPDPLPTLPYHIRYLSDLQPLTHLFFKKKFTSDDENHVTSILKRILAQPMGFRILASLIENKKHTCSYTKLESLLELIYGFHRDLTSSPDFQDSVGKALLHLHKDKFNNPMPQLVNVMQVEISQNLIKNHQVSSLYRILSETQNYELWIQIVESCFKKGDLETLEILLQQNHLKELLAIDSRLCLPGLQITFETSQDLPEISTLKLTHNQEMIARYAYKWIAIKMASTQSSELFLNFISKHQLADKETFSTFIQQINTPEAQLRDFLPYYFKFLAFSRGDLKIDYFNTLHKILKSKIQIEHNENLTSYLLYILSPPLRELFEESAEGYPSITIEWLLLAAKAIETSKQQQSLYSPSQMRQEALVLFKDTLASGKSLLLDSSAVKSLQQLCSFATLDAFFKAFSIGSPLLKIHGQGCDHFFLQTGSFESNLDFVLPLYEQLAIEPINVYDALDVKGLSPSDLYRVIQGIQRLPYFQSINVEFLLTLKYLDKAILAKNFNLEQFIATFKELQTLSKHSTAIGLNQLYDCAQAFLSIEALEETLTHLEPLSDHLPAEEEANSTYYDQVYEEIDHPFTIRYKQNLWVAKAIYLYKSFREFSLFTAEHDLFSLSLYRLCIENQSFDNICQRTLFFIETFQDRSTIFERLFKHPLFKGETLVQYPELLKKFLPTIHPRSKPYYLEEIHFQQMIQGLLNKNSEHEFEQIEDLDLIFSALAYLSAQNKFTLRKPAFDKAAEIVKLNSDLTPFDQEVLQRLIEILDRHQELENLLFHMTNKINNQNPTPGVTAIFSFVSNLSINIDKIFYICLNYLINIPNNPLDFENLNRVRSEMALNTLQQDFPEQFSTQNLAGFIQHALDSSQRPWQMIDNLKSIYHLINHLIKYQWPLDWTQFHLSEWIDTFEQKINFAELNFEESSLLKRLIAHLRQRIGLLESAQIAKNLKRKPDDDSLEGPYPYKKQK